MNSEHAQVHAEPILQVQTLKFIHYYIAMEDRDTQKLEYSLATCNFFHLTLHCDY